MRKDTEKLLRANLDEIGKVFKEILKLKDGRNNLRIYASIFDGQLVIRVKTKTFRVPRIPIPTSEWTYEDAYSPQFHEEEDCPAIHVAIALPVEKEGGEREWQ